MSHFNYKKFEKLKLIDINQDFKDCKGIYFLMIDNYVVYVGMSNISIYNRFFGSFGNEGHIHNKYFNKFKILNLDNYNKNEILKIEFYYINLFNPVYNITSKKKLYFHELPKKYFDNSKIGLELYNIYLEKINNKKLQLYDLL